MKNESNQKPKVTPTPLDFINGAYNLVLRPIFDITIFVAPKVGVIAAVIAVVLGLSALAFPLAPAGLALLTLAGVTAGACLFGGFLSFLGKAYIESKLDSAIERQEKSQVIATRTEVNSNTLTKANDTSTSNNTIDGQARLTTQATGENTGGTPDFRSSDTDGEAKGNSNNNP